MTPTDKEMLDMQLRIQMGMSWDDAGLPSRLKSDWDALQKQVDILTENGVVVDVLGEWSDFDDEALAEIYAEWNPEELENYENGIMLDDAQKSVDGPTLVSKAVEERMFTLGPMYIPNIKDAHAEWTDPEELQKAVWEYVKKGDRRIRLQHDRDVVAGEWLEIMAWPYEVEAPIIMKDASESSMKFPANTVFLGVRWEPWAWDMIKNGKLRGYSIGGRAERLLADLPEEYVAKAQAPFEDAIRIEAEDVASPVPEADLEGRIASAVAEAMKSINPVINVVMPDDKPKVRRLERDENGNILRVIEE